VLAWNLRPAIDLACRRCIALIADIAHGAARCGTSATRALPCVLVYVWVTLANGFPLRPAYLLISLGVSLAGFARCWRPANSGRRTWWPARASRWAVALSLYVLSLGEAHVRRAWRAPRPPTRPSAASYRS
jgi:hypothetical protein